MLSDLNIFHGIMSDFVSFLSFGFSIVTHKAEKFRFRTSLNYFNIFFEKKVSCQIRIFLMEKCLTLFHFRNLGSL